MARNYGELLAHANIACLEKLNENSHKPGFDTISLGETFNGLQEEVIELKNEILSSYNPDTIRREAADVANYAAMIILFCDRWKESIGKIKDKPLGPAKQTGNTHGGGYGD